MWGRLVTYLQLYALNHDVLMEEVLDNNCLAVNKTLFGSSLKVHIARVFKILSFAVFRFLG